MKININIPNHLASTVAKILECSLSIYDSDDEKYIMGVFDMDIDDDDKCPDCDGNPCECGLCIYCAEDPCSCAECTYCGSRPCVC